MFYFDLKEKTKFEYHAWSNGPRECNVDHNFGADKSSSELLFESRFSKRTNKFDVLAK